MNLENPTRIHSFILRAWNDEADGQKPPRWRYVLVDATSADRRGFTSLAALFTALSQEIGHKALTPCAYTELLREVEEFLGLRPTHSPD